MYARHPGCGLFPLWQTPAQQQRQRQQHPEQHHAQCNFCKLLPLPPPQLGPSCKNRFHPSTILSFLNITTDSAVNLISLRIFFRARFDRLACRFSYNRLHQYRAKRLLPVYLDVDSLFTVNPSKVNISEHTFLTMFTCSLPKILYIAFFSHTSLYLFTNLHFFTVFSPFEPVFSSLSRQFRAFSRLFYSSVNK